jgi:hypothetical protein
MITRIVSALLIALLCACGTSRTPQTGATDPATGPVSERFFQLLIHEMRTDSRRSPATGQVPPVEQELVLRLSGRVVDDGPVITFFADSLAVEGKKPFPYQTFMSADTIYYLTETGPGAINRTGSAGLDSMLNCLFGGITVRIRTGGDGLPDSVLDAAAGCGSGEYSRLNAAVTLASFVPGWRDGSRRWRVQRPVPSYSGTGYHPEVVFLYRSSGSQSDNRRVSVTADTTVTDVAHTMKNGEVVTIASDRFRVGGTMAAGAGGGPLASGELRIREEQTLVRINAGGQIIDRLGEYTIRLSLSPPK